MTILRFIYYCLRCPSLALYTLNIMKFCIHRITYHGWRRLWVVSLNPTGQKRQRQKGDMCNLAGLTTDLTISNIFQIMLEK